MWWSSLLTKLKVIRDQLGRVVSVVGLNVVYVVGVGVSFVGMKILRRDSLKKTGWRDYQESDDLEQMY